MAITVIKPGTDPQNEYSTICPNCGTIIRYDYADAISEAPISSWHELHLVCPTCNQYIGHNPRPIKKEQIECSDAMIWITREGATVIPSGCKAYGIYVNGSVIEVHEFDTVIPLDVPSLIIGSFSELEILVGTNVEDPHKNMVKVPVVEISKEYNQEAYFKIDENFMVVPTTSDDIYGFLCNRTNFDEEVPHFDL